MECFGRCVLRCGLPNIGRTFSIALSMLQELDEAPGAGVAFSGWWGVERDSWQA